MRQLHTGLWCAAMMTGMGALALAQPTIEPTDRSPTSRPAATRPVGDGTRQGVCGVADGDGPTVFRFAVYPQLYGAPSLTHRLLPAPTEMTEGNAAPLYLLAFLQLAQTSRQDPAFDPRTLAFDAAPRQAAQQPQGEAPALNGPSAVSAAEAYLRARESALHWATLAGRREECRWDLPLREEGFALLLPHVASARELGRIVALDARLQLARDKFPAATAALRTNFALARNIGRHGVLVEGLYGAGIARETMAEVRTWAGRRSAPNLYFPLANLPRPFIDPRGLIGRERIGLLGPLRHIKENVEAGTFDAADWREVVHYLTRMEPNRGQRASPGLDRAALLGVALYPRAKQFLMANGSHADAVDAMPVPLVLGRYVLQDYETWFDEIEKWAGLPYWQAHAGLEQVEARFIQYRDAPLANPLLRFLPTLDHAMFALVQVDREIAAMQTVEALRHYAVLHYGALPQRLSDLDEAPAPLDPTTGEAFRYSVNGHVATIESPAPAGLAPASGMRMEVTFQP